MKDVPCAYVNIEYRRPENVRYERTWQRGALSYLEENVINFTDKIRRPGFHPQSSVLSDSTIKDKGYSISVIQRLTLFQAAIQYATLSQRYHFCLPRRARWWKAVE